MSKLLTAAGVARLRATQDRCREIPDGGCLGLYLLIYPSGRKSWALRYRRPSDGRPAKLTLGTVYTATGGSEIDVKPVIGGHLSLGAAHRLVAELRHEIALGRDPGPVHLAAKRNIVTSDRFGGAALDFIEQHAMRQTRRWRDQARLLGLRPKADGKGFETIKKGLADRWRDEPLASIDGDRIHALIEETREKGIPGLQRHRLGPSESRARSVYATLSTMFSWLIQKRRLREHPCVGVARPKTPEARERKLTDSEIVLFWKATDKVSEPFGQLLKLLLLTGCRLNEVARMRRVELTDDGLTWAIPKDRTKNHRAHVVALPKLASDILASVETDGDLIFTTNGKTPISGWSKAKAKLDSEMLAEARREATATGRDLSKTKIDPWRLHDLRRTAAAGMQRLEISLPVIERTLNHVSGSFAGIVGVYQVYDFEPEKKVALERWANHVENLVSGRKARVVQFRGRKRG